MPTLGKHAVFSKRSSLSIYACKEIDEQADKIILRTDPLIITNSFQDIKNICNQKLSVSAMDGYYGNWIKEHFVDKTAKTKSRLFMKWSEKGFK